MSKLGTLRERVEHASEYFHDFDGVMLTTFNLSATFLEDHALPTVLGVEAKTTATRRAELHHRLGTTPCTVFYDPAHSPKLSGAVPIHRAARAHPWTLLSPQARRSCWPVRRRYDLGVSGGLVGQPHTLRLGPQRRVVRRNLDPHPAPAELGFPRRPAFLAR